MIDKIHNSTKNGGVYMKVRKILIPTIVNYVANGEGIGFMRGILNILNIGRFIESDFAGEYILFEFIADSDEYNKIINTLQECKIEHTIYTK